MSSDVNNACDICGAVELIPFRCKHCGGVFCGDHRLPENHNCKTRQIENYIITGDKTDNEHFAPVKNFKTYHAPAKYRQKRKRNKYSRKLKRLLHRSTMAISNLVPICIIAFVLGGLFIGYYVYVYEPNTVTLMNDNTYYTNATGATMKIHNNPNAHNPTYQELYNFIVYQDDTDKIPYNPNSFVCIDYGVKVHDNAEKANISSGVVIFGFSDFVDGHVCNVFNTIDRGLVYIDCTHSYPNYGPSNDDKVVSVPNVGGKYVVQPLTNIGNFYYDQWDWTIKDYNIFW